MKTIFAALLILVSSWSFAQATEQGDLPLGREAKKVGLECSMSGGPGETRIEILSNGEFVQHFKGTVGTIYSCGPFVNDGHVIIDSQTQFVEVQPDTCAIVRELSLSYMIYCRP